MYIEINEYGAIIIGYQHRRYSKVFQKDELKVENVEKGEINSSFCSR